MSAKDFNKAAGRVQAFTASTQLTTHHCNGDTLLTNRGATGAITLTLPPGGKGLHVKVQALADHDITVDPYGTEILNDQGTALAAGEYQKIDDLGGMLEYIHDGTAWIHVYERGTITNE